MSSQSTSVNEQYHPRHQWLNDAAVDYHTELSKPTGVRDDEKVDNLRSEIWAGLRDFFKFLSVTKNDIGTQTPDDIVHNLLVAAMEVSNAKGEPGWLDRFQISKGIPFLGYIAWCAKGGTSHTKRSETPGSGRTQDETRRFHKELARRREEFPDETPDNAHREVFNLMGVGIEQIKNIEALSALHIMSTEHPIGEGIVLGDTLQAEEPGISVIDRTTVQLRLSRMPERYRSVVECLMDGGVEGLHDLKFGKKLTLAEKVVVFSTALKVAQECSHRRPDRS